MPRAWPCLQPRSAGHKLWASAVVLLLCLTLGKSEEEGSKRDMIHPSGVAQPDSKLNEEIARLYQSHHGGTDDMVSLRLNSEIGSAAAALR